ncbi:MAG: hypothetical protein JO372_07680 [Solirubrobacterales bacterium]|nr:hypothetical protein [Solirubrobacterales bacterium]
MSALVIITVVSALALLASIPGDFARRGGTGSVVGLGSIANSVLPGLAFWGGSQTGLAHGVAGFATIVAATILGNVLADRVATHVWGPVAAS